MRKCLLGLMTFLTDKRNIIENILCANSADIFKQYFQKEFFPRELKPGNVISVYKYGAEDTAFN